MLQPWPPETAISNRDHRPLKPKNNHFGFAVAIGGRNDKNRGPARGEELQNIISLLRIEEDLGEVAHYVQL